MIPWIASQPLRIRGSADPRLTSNPSEFWSPPPGFERASRRSSGALRGCRSRTHWQAPWIQADRFSKQGSGDTVCIVCIYLDPQSPFVFGVVLCCIHFWGVLSFLGVLVPCLGVFVFPCAALSTLQFSLAVCLTCLN